MADNPLVLLVETVHRSTSKSDTVPQFAGVIGQRGVLPCATRRPTIPYNDGKPGDGAQFAMFGCAVFFNEDTWSDIGTREERDRVETWLMEQEQVLAFCDPLTG